MGIPFQTTVGQSGSVLGAERIARLCYGKFESGATKEEVVEFRNSLYQAANQAANLKEERVEEKKDEEPRESVAGVEDVTEVPKKNRGGRPKKAVPEQDMKEEEAKEVVAGAEDVTAAPKKKGKGKG